VTSADLDAVLDGQAGPKILTLDLERIPGRVTLDMWHPSDVKRMTYIGPERWESLPRTICLTAKWYGKRPEFVAEWDNPDDEYHVARRAWELIDAADVIVTYNGKRADLKWLQQDWDMARLPAPTPYKHVDLFAMNTRWAFERRSLSHLLDRLSMANKDGHYNADEARAAVAGDEKARKRLARYNTGDVKVTEALFDRLRHHVKGINLGVYYPDCEDVNRCPRCGEADTLRDAGWYTAEQYRYAMRRCDACGGLSRLGHIKRRSGVRAVS
jgi:hypothetical protein